MVYLRLTDSLTLDPGRIEDYYSQEVVFNIFEGLVRLRPDRMEVEPCLAQRWSAKENGRRWIFHLRRGVIFHNGEAFNAAAVVTTFRERLARRSDTYGSFGRFFPYLLDVRALDDWTVEFLLAKPYSQFPLALVDQRASIVAVDSCAGAGFNPVGTGPFVFSEWIRGRTIVISRFDSYWGGAPRLDRVVFKCEPSTAHRLLQLKNRSADINFIRSAKEHDELLGRNEIGIVSEPKMITYFLGFNCRRPPFSARAARKAFFHLLDKNTLVKRIFQNFAIAASGMLPPMSPGYDPDIGRDDYNLGKARRLLRQAGMNRELSCRMYYSEGQFGMEDVAKALAASARSVGIVVRPKKLPFAELLKAVQDGIPEMFLLGWGYAGDPGVLMNPMFMLYPGSRSSTMTAGSAFTALLALAESTEDPVRRARAYDAAQRQLQKELPLIPLFYLHHTLAYNKRLRGLRMNPFGFLIFKDASLSAE